MCRLPWRSCRNLKPRVAAGKIAIRKAEPRERAAETSGVGLLDGEARLERHPAQRRADRIGLHPDGSGRQGDETHRSRATHLDGADHRPIGIDPACPAGALEAGIAEISAGNEALGFWGLELARPRWHYGDNACDYNDATPQHARLHFHNLS